MDRTLIVVWYLLHTLCLCQGNNLNEKLTVIFEDGDVAPYIIDASESTNFNVTCDTGNAYNAAVKWSKIGDPYFTVNSATLEIMNLKRENNGVYKCTASSEAAYSKQVDVGVKTITLNVLYAPSRPVIQGPRSVVIGRQLTMLCSSDSNPPPTYRWTIKNIPSSGVVARGPRLQYRQETSVHELRVVCLADVTLTPTRGEPKKYDVNTLTIVDLLVPASIFELPQSAYLIVGRRDGYIQCNVRGKPRPKIWWTKTDDTSFAQSGGYLSLSNVKREDAGVYTCHVENVLEVPGQDAEVVKRSENILVTVDAPAHILELPKRAQLIIGHDGYIECKATGQPHPKIWWRKGDSTFDVDGRYLRLPSVKREDAGVYTCHVENVLRAPGQKPEVVRDIKHIRVTVDDPTFPASCAGFCSRERICNSSSTAKISQSCENTCNNMGLIVAMAIGWLVAVMLFVIGLFYCIRHRDRSAKLNLDHSNQATAKPNINAHENQRSLPSAPYNPLERGQPVQRYMELESESSNTNVKGESDETAVKETNDREGNPARNTYLIRESDETAVKETNDREGNPARNTYLIPTDPDVVADYLQL